MPNKTYEIVTQKILDQLDQGVKPWQKPWAGCSRPVNLDSKKPYRGINVLLLAGSGFTSRYWATYKQAQKHGGNVRKGEKSTLVVFYKQIDVDKEKDDGSTEQKQIPVLRYYNVFNLDQCEGIPDPDLARSAQDQGTLHDAQEVIDNMPNKPEIEHGIADAYYDGKADSVHLPDPRYFHSAYEYYAVAYHELMHSTGHKIRLDRPRFRDSVSFGSATYAKEELIAEIGAAFLADSAGIMDKVFQNQCAYVENWIREALQNDATLIVQAASQAQKAADYILNA